MPTPVIQWFREGVEIQPSRDFQISVFMNKSYLFIPEVFPEDAGTFSVQAVNEFGLVECRSVLVVEGKWLLSVHVTLGTLCSRSRFVSKFIRKILFWHWRQGLAFLHGSWIICFQFFYFTSANKWQRLIAVGESGFVVKVNVINWNSLRDNYKWIMSINRFAQLCMYWRWHYVLQRYHVQS